MFAERAVLKNVAAAKAREHAGGDAMRSRWRAAKRVLALLFALVVLGLLLNYARAVDWPAVLTALQDYPLPTLLAAAGLALASHAVYCSYDLLGRHHTGHTLTTLQVVGVTFVSYTFNLNLGTLVGGIAMRYRLYARLGLTTEVTSQVLVLSLLTNWLGYLAVAGGMFLLSPIELPPDGSVGSTGLRMLGAGLWLAAAGYLALCFLSRRRTWQLRGRTVELPSGRLALLQLGLSSINWLLIGAVVHVLLQQKIDYPTVLCVLLVAAVAGVIAHVPAGLGVLEAVFVALLAHRIAPAPLLAALLAYRAVYYLVPMGFATVVFAVLEMRARRAGAGTQAT